MAKNRLLSLNNPNNMAIKENDANTTNKGEKILKVMFEDESQTLKV